MISIKIDWFDFLAVQGTLKSLLQDRNVGEVAQLCPILCDPMDCSLPSSSIHRISQARTVEWVAICFSKGSSPTQGSNPGLPHCRQILYQLSYQGSPNLTGSGGSDGKGSACNVGDLGWIPGSGRSPGQGNGNPLHCSCLENPVDRGAWQATVHGVAKSQT